MGFGGVGSTWINEDLKETAGERVYGNLAKRRMHFDIVDVLKQSIGLMLHGGELSPLTCR